MLFSSLPFVFQFWPAAFAAAALSRLLGYRVFLLATLAASLWFYASFRADYLVLLIVSAASNYIVAGLIPSGRRHWLYILTVAANILGLGWFKYADFAISNLRLLGVDIAPLRIMLPLAISFITFEQIAFLSDVHNGKVDRGSPLEFFAFITFFPKLIAGPIIRYTEILPQFRARRPALAAETFAGLCMFCIGIFKKVAIADTLSPLVGRVYDAATVAWVSASDAVLATIAYAERIYFDFSGYSDMAIGLALMLGIRLPVNFLSPYKATSIVKFWRRWHITLSRFLRDYVYIPLGGNRSGFVRTQINVMIVMLIGGLWHGAGWTFVAWGALHGAGLVINHAWRASGRSLPAPIGWLLTMALVLAGWVFFRAPDFSAAFNVFASLANPVGSHLLDSRTTAIVIIVVLLAVAAPNSVEITGYSFDAPIRMPLVAVSALSAVAFVIAILLLSRGTINAFIYFQF